MHLQKAGKSAFVGKGFNWFAFVFAWGWLLSRGLWKSGIVIMLIDIPLYFFSSVINLTFLDGIHESEVHFLLPSILILIIHLFVGIKGNQWRREALQAKGYKKV